MIRRTLPNNIEMQTGWRKKKKNGLAALAQNILQTSCYQYLNNEPALKYES